MLINLWSDLRYAARSLSRSPGFTVAAVATIALGIGVNAGVFTVLNGVLFRDLPAPDAHELVSIQQTVEGAELTARTGFGTFSMAEYRTYRDRTRTLSGVLAHANSTATTLGGDVPRRVEGTLVTCNYFDVLRQPPTLGRGLTAQDCELGAERVVVLGHTLWTTDFGSDTAIVGRSVELNRQLFAVVGVAAEGTYGGSSYQVGYFAPLSADPLLGPAPARLEDPKYHWLTLIGRRADGIGTQQVRAELGVIAAQIDQDQPGRSTALAIDRAIPVSVLTRAFAIGTAAVLMGAFGSVLLIACANVANLLLARGTTKSREIGIRLSIGASRARVIRQLLAESMLISIAGGLLGCALALWSFDGLVALALPALQAPWETTSYVWNVSPDLRVFGFSAALTLGTGILCGLAPALHVSKPDLQIVTKQDSAGSGGSRRGGRLRATLVGLQVAVCMTLLISAALLLRGLYMSYTIEPGFAYHDVVYASLDLPRAGYSPEEVAALRQRFSNDVRALPGVEAVAPAMSTPFGDENFTVGIGLPGESESDMRRARMNVVAPEYFSLLELPIVRGRTFTEAELAIPRGTPTLPAIVSETTARNLWGERDPLGQTIRYGDSSLEVVGVAADAQHSTLGAIDPYFFYLPGGNQVLLIKSRIDFGAVASGIRTIARALEPNAVVSVLPLEANIGWRRGVSATVSSLGTALSALALALAAVGIYGVVSYAVTRRYREIGIRMALGASSKTVLGLIVRQTMRPVVVGAVLGVAAGAAVSRVLSGVLFGVSAVDPVGFSGAVLLLVGVALAASLLAARAATRADPTATLRYE